MKGAYLLIMHLKHDATIRIGKLGLLFFQAGWYIYAGSALNGLEQRIARHMRVEKKLHWHIDYLLQQAAIIDVFYKKAEKKEECLIAQRLHNHLQSVPGFGCSDCSCPSHLFFGTEKQIQSAVKSLGMKRYLNTNTYNR